MIEEVLACIESVSFSGGNEKAITSIEGAIIRDADRLDAIGAIGIAEHSHLAAQGEENYMIRMR